MFNIGFTELLLLGLIALIFIGPHQLPEVARTLGRLLNEWKRATGDIQSNFMDAVKSELSERRETATHREQGQDAEKVSEHGEVADVHAGTPGGTDQSAQKVEGSEQS